MSYFLGGYVDGLSLCFVMKLEIGKTAAAVVTKTTFLGSLMVVIDGPIVESALVARNQVGVTHGS